MSRLAQNADNKKIAIVSILLIAILAAGFTFFFHKDRVLAPTTVEDRDKKLRLDLEALASSNETYYNQRGEYPDFEQMSDSSWRSENLPNLDPAILEDGVLKNPKKGKIAYQPGSRNGYTCGANAGVKCETFIFASLTYDGERPISENSVRFFERPQ